jgi:hypothetical protein
MHTDLVITEAINDDDEEENWSDCSAFINQILESDNINISGSEKEKYNLNLNLLPRDYGFIKNLKIRIKYRI